MAASIASGRATRSVTGLALGAICLLGSITLPLYAQTDQFSFGGPPAPQCTPNGPRARRQPCVPLTGPATIAYVPGIYPVPQYYAGVFEYSIAPADNGAKVGALYLPPGDGEGDIATDSFGQIYVAATNKSTCQILVYPSGSVGGVAPSREIIDASCADLVAVDPVGRVYAARLGDCSIPTTTTVTVYSAMASGAASPLRTLQLTDVCNMFDMAADVSGNIYVAAWMLLPNSQAAIAVYSSDAAGPATSSRTIIGPPAVVGVAVDAKGDIFADVALSSDNNFPDYAIEEFAPGAEGVAAPTNTITLPTPPPFAFMVRSGRVRLDPAGNTYTSVTLWPEDVLQPASYVMYGFAPAATGSATPFVQTQFAGELFFPSFAIN